jgi:hypothetical protein
MAIASELAELDEQRKVVRGIHAMTVSGTQCFYCGQKITNGRAVYWDGATGPALFLHGGCTLDFVVRLMSDVRGLQTLESSRAELVGGLDRPRDAAD